MRGGYVGGEPLPHTTRSTTTHRMDRAGPRRPQTGPEVEPTYPTVTATASRGGLSVRLSAASTDSFLRYLKVGVSCAFCIAM